jgi:glycosyltransferase involved in cell wall biosynthesis
MANVLSVTTYKILPAKFGGQKGIALFNEYLSKHHNFFCFTIKDNLPSEASYRVFNKMGTGKLRYINPFNFFPLRKLIRAHKISHVIIEHPYLGWMGCMLQLFCGVKLIVHSHNIESERFRSTGKWWWKIMWRYERWVHEKADFTFCISENDRQYFTARYGIPETKTAVIPYGISWNSCPAGLERMNARKELLKLHQLKIETTLFLFNGAMDYPPNYNAVSNILNFINPQLKEENTNYRIIICGRHLPEEIKVKALADPNIIYAGFVDDIDIYFKGADIFINPVTFGGGIKTKLVEALGSNLNAVSTQCGAIGVNPEICNGKLLISGDSDWFDFTVKMKEAEQIKNSISKEFFHFFYWDNIAVRASTIIGHL